MRIDTMATYLSLLIRDASSGAVVCDRWLGGSATLAVAQKVLGSRPSSFTHGLESWADVDPESVCQIAAASDAYGADPDEVALLSSRFPRGQYAWMVVRDF